MRLFDHGDVFEYLHRCYEFVDNSWLSEPSLKSYNLKPSYMKRVALFVYRTGLISSLMGEKSVTQRWEVGEAMLIFAGLFGSI
jgi:hypothetical protein